MGRQTLPSASASSPDPRRGKLVSALDQAEHALLDAVGKVSTVFQPGTHSAFDLALSLLDLGLGLIDLRGETLSDALAAAIKLTAALAQFALDARTGLAHLALEPVAGGGSAALEFAQLGLGLG